MDNLYNRVSRRRQPGQKGFTLIELLVVIAVLAILAAIVIFNVVGVTKRGNASACQTDVKSIQTAMDAYYNDQTPAGWAGHFTAGTYTNAGNSADPYPQFNVLQTGGYLHTNPGNSCDTITVTDQTISAGVVGKQVTGLPS
jgi:prepilin-type N-terminal cleavage/methylation domain-containing protein